MKNPVLFRFLILVAVVTIGFQHQVLSQSIKSSEFVVEGKVNNPQGEKAIGVAILVKGTTIGTVTDTTGHFTLKVPSSQSVLVITHFSTSKSLEVPVDGKKKLEIKLEADDSSQAYLYDSSGENQVFDRVEENPRPVSGDDGWNAYLAKNIRYPQNDRQNGIEGTVIVGFEIHADGSVQNAEVLRGIGGESDQEAVRVIAAGPNWQPGRIGGEAVNTRMSFPVQFKLSGYPTSDALAQSREAAIANLYGKERLVVIGYAPVSSR